MINRMSRWRLLIPSVIAGLFVGVPILSHADAFEETLARVDRSLRTNPQHAVPHALSACQSRRAFATRLYYAGHTARAERSLKYCLKLLKLPNQVQRQTVDRAKQSSEALAKKRAIAQRELDLTLSLTPDLANGLEIYQGCAACHTPEGWGLTSGVVPQLAGQHQTVVIKQLADIRSGNRANRLMLPYASAEAIGGAQAVADVAGYIDTLEISVENGKGEGKNLELGAKLFAENCVRCHGANGEGDEEKFRPRIQSQHYNYLVVQFEQIRGGQRQNADPEMVAQIAKFEEREMRAVLDYVSRLKPPEELQAPPGWNNPDF